MAGSLRHKFAGSTVSFDTAYTGALVITAISKASPAVVTSTAHGLSVGAVVKITGVTGMTELNGKSFVVSVSTANTFSLFETDSTAYNTYVSGGAVATATMSNWCELKSFERGGGSSPEIDVSTICSTASEFEIGLKNYGNLTMSYNYAPSVIQTALETSQTDGSKIMIKRSLPNNAGNTIYTGFVQELGESAEVGGVWSGSATIKLSGGAFSYV